MKRSGGRAAEEPVPKVSCLPSGDADIADLLLDSEGAMVVRQHSRVTASAASVGVQASSLVLEVLTTRRPTLRWQMVVPR